ncbi:MAG: hypothetical protein JRI80_05455 [Deltaproteobacteria bacterium]|nr:hypothetical protein [Deltaproteobacteria bacterium]
MGGKALVNILNYLHFSDRPVFVHIQKNGDSEGFLLPVYPEPCLDGEIACRFASDSGIEESGEEVKNLIIDDGKSMIMVPAGLKDMDKRSFTIYLPETSYVIARREAKRYPCSGVSAEIRKNGQVFQGELRDFGPAAFRVILDKGSAFRRSFLKVGDTAAVELKKRGAPCFSGTCTCLRVASDFGHWEAVFSPPAASMQVFKKRTVRNPRVQLKPSPTISFEHPLLQRQFHMEVSDICSSGVSISEEDSGCLLFPGMRIPELTVCYAGSIVAHCSAQVVYRNEEKDGNMRCGIAVLDTKSNGYTRLNHLVENALDPCAQVSGKIDPDVLWEFFFSAGFIYPKKYHLLSPSKGVFKENARKILQDASEIVQHFTYEKNGRLYGYHSIVWAYERSWLIHHHAGRSMGNRMGGLMVLKQTMHYLNDMHRFKSSHMQYAMTYFRPENRFPNLVFGRFAKRIKDRQACSVDLFSYISVGNRFLDVRLPRNWYLARLSESDRDDLREFYRTHSGGLLLDAMSLDSGGEINEELEAMYSKHGLLRRMDVYALKRAEQTMAIFIADHSDRGLNLSELLNCIKVIVLRAEELPWKVLHKAVSQLAQKYDMEKIPVMCYPSHYLEKKGIPSEKTYQLWILSVDAGDAFMEYMHQRLRIC